MNSVTKIRKLLKQQKGIALFEMLPLLVVFIALIGLTVGLWGAVHSGVLQSIAARHYAFEVINNRSHFEYHRDYDRTTLGSSSLMYNRLNDAPDLDGYFHGKNEMRFFGILGDKAPDAKDPYVTHRGINFFEEIGRDYQQNPKGQIGTQEETLGASFHNNTSASGLRAVNPLWIMVGYGMCLDCLCGDNHASVCR